MKSTVVGWREVKDKGYILFLTFEPKSTSIEGEAVCTIFSKEYHAIGDDTIDIACMRTSDGYKYYERI